MVMLHIKLKLTTLAATRLQIVLPTDTPSTQGMGSICQTIYFSESSHVAYQIKADDAGSNKGWGQKVKLYLLLKVISHVAYQIKGN